MRLGCHLLQLNVKLNRDNVDISYPPIVQSGGAYDLRPSAANDERPLQYDVVLLAIGAPGFPKLINFLSGCKQRSLRWSTMVRTTSALKSTN